MECDRRDCSGSIGADPRKFQQPFIICRKLSGILFFHYSSSLFQISCSAVVPQAFPEFHEPVVTASGKRLNIRKLLHKPFIIRLYRLHSGLLKHDLRKPHMIGRRIPAPGQLPVPAFVPGT